MTCIQTMMTAIPEYSTVGIRIKGLVARWMDTNQVYVRASVGSCSAEGSRSRSAGFKFSQMRDSGLFPAQCGPCHRSLFRRTRYLVILTPTHLPIREPSSSFILHDPALAQLRALYVSSAYLLASQLEQEDGHRRSREDNRKDSICSCTRFNNQRSLDGQASPFSCWPPLSLAETVETSKFACAGGSLVQFTLQSNFDVSHKRPYQSFFNRLNTCDIMSSCAPTCSFRGSW